MISNYVPVSASTVLNSKPSGADWGAVHLGRTRQAYVVGWVKASSHIGDTTRHDSMRHDPFFRSPYNQMDQFTYMQHDNVLSSRQTAAAPKIALEAIFVMCRSDSIKKTAEENSFHRNLTWFSKLMTQEYSLKSQYLQLNVTQVVVL